MKKKLERTRLWIVTLAIISCLPTLHSQIISTIAGTGTASYTGDGGQATSATLNRPYDVCIDNAGNVLVADGLNNCIRKIDQTTGIITTIAGTGVAGYNGDGILATNAQLNNPSGIAVDQFGNIYIADWHNFRIRKIDYATGIITTIAGTGVQGYSGDGGPAVNAQFKNPLEIVVDNVGNIYIVDSWGLVRKVNTSGIVTTIAGSPGYGYGGDGGQAINAQFDHPRGLALDYAGHLYISDAFNHRIRVIDLSTGIITTYAGTGTAGYNGDGGQATSAMITRPEHLTIDAAGNLLIADRGNNRIRKVDISTGIITTVAGTGVAGYNGDGIPAVIAQLNRPRGVAVDVAGYIYIADLFNHRIRKIGGPLPVAYFTADDTTICEGESIQFTDTSFNSPTSWQWTFNGGIPATSMLQNPVVTFPNAGSYSVKLVVSNSAGSDSLTKTSYITVFPTPKANFTGGSNCSYALIQFTDSSTAFPDSIVAWDWTFTDGVGFINTSNVENPLIQFPGTGTYTAMLIVTSSQGCKDSITKPVSVFPLPVADFTYNAQCFGITSFTQTATGGTGEMLYMWDLQNNQIPDTNAANFTYQYNVNSDTLVEVYFSVTDANGCQNDTVKQVLVKGSIDSIVMPNILILNSTVPGNSNLDFQTFAPGFNHCVTYTLRVYNRWGNLVYTTQNKAASPDLTCSDCFVGKSAKGATLSDGTYYYVLLGTDIDGGKYEYTGALQIVNAE